VARTVFLFITEPEPPRQHTALHARIAGAIFDPQAVAVFLMGTTPPSMTHGISSKVTMNYNIAITGGSSMNSEYQELTHRLSSSIADLRKDKRELMQGFSGMAAAAMADGALDKKTKELIALAIGIAGHCKGCIGFHVQTLIKLGATRAEIEDALSVAIYMGGGPSLMYAAETLQAFDEFQKAHS